MSDTPPIGRVRGLNEPPAGLNPAPEPSPEAPKKAEPAPPPPPASPAFAMPPAAPAKPPEPPKPLDRPRPRRDDDGPAPRSQNDIDRDIDAAMESAVGRSSVEDVNFKRQKDEDLEAELEDLMAGFDPNALDISGTKRTRAADRAHAPKGGIGQEERQGIQQAKVVALRGNTIFLDLGAKSEGIVPTDQFGSDLPNVGDMIEVVFDHFDHSEGLLVMSRKGAALAATWENLRKGMIVEARVTKAVKGGVEVDVNGIRGFMPISQIDNVRVESGADYLNQKLRAVVTELSQREKNLVVSRRELLEQERAEMREKTWAELEEGQVRTGTVRSIKPFGAFVDLGGVDGLLPIGELSWSRVADPTEIVSTGQQVEVKILKIDRGAQRLTLGLKQLAPSPWDTIDERFSRGETVNGKVTRLMDFGAFVELEPGIEGLIHITELGPKKVFRVKDIVQPGQEVAVRILKIEPEMKRISLTLRPLAPTQKVEEEPEEEEVESTPKPVRKVPLKGGLGDGDPNPFGKA